MLYDLSEPICLYSSTSNGDFSGFKVDSVSSQNAAFINCGACEGYLMTPRSTDDIEKFGEFAKFLFDTNDLSPVPQVLVGVIGSDATG